MFVTSPLNGVSEWVDSIMRDLMACEPCNVPGNAPMDSKSGVIMAGLSMQKCVRIPRSSTSDLIQLVLFHVFPSHLFSIGAPFSRILRHRRKYVFALSCGVSQSLTRQGLSAHVLVPESPLFPSWLWPSWVLFTSSPPTYFYYASHPFARPCVTGENASFRLRFGRCLTDRPTRPHPPGFLHCGIYMLW